MTQRKKKLVTVYLTEAQDAGLRALHTATRVPMAVYIRDGIDLILENNAQQLASPPVSSGGTDE